jgi:aspartate/methionine/tyrosine aminotransferase
MKYVRMPIEIESPEQMGYDAVKYNLTESSFRDARFGELNLDLKDVVLCYGDHLGHPGLRKWVAKSEGVREDRVLLTVGAASALFIVATSLLKKGDRLLVLRPNYATNIETPRAIGCEIDFLDLKFENGYRVSIEELIAKIRPETKLVSVTTPHNPTGVAMSEADLRALAEVTRERGITLLVDETYRDMHFGKLPPNAATLGSHVISVSSLSKTYGLPGIRMGWLLCEDEKLFETFLAAKEQIFITGSWLDETVALQYLEHRDRVFPVIQAQIQKHFQIVKKWFQGEPNLEWVETEGGVVAFPRIRQGRGVDVEKFYDILNRKYGTFVGPGHWFEQDRRSFRIGFGWPTTAELETGLAHISKALAEAKI